MTKVLDSKTRLFNAISLCLAFCFVDFRFLDGNKEELRRKECESKCDENSGDDDEKQLNAC